MINNHESQLVYSQKFFEDCLIRGGWKPVSLEEGLYLIIHQGKTDRFPIYGKFVPENYFVSFQGVYPYPIPEEKLPFVLEYINYANYGVPFGNLELEESTHEVCFRTSLMFFNIELTGQLINNLIHNCIKAMERYLPGIPLIIEKNLNVQESYEAALSSS
ncbi:MAG: hypothetical protein V7K26_01310 [Nostoc sp.]|uniref:hypothetical protein n=1 Tax=Nostoc sp. TaxID=1180 RepID=UPI002FEF7372